MLTLLHTPMQTCVLLILFCLILPATLSAGLLTNLKYLHWMRMRDETREDETLSPIIHKRETSGSDPWSLCPHSMERVDCFYEYLRVYAKLRKATSVSNSVSPRNIGKR